MYYWKRENENQVNCAFKFTHANKNEKCNLNKIIDGFIIHHVYVKWKNSY